MFQTPTLLQLFLYYAWLDLSFEKFLGAYRLCLNKFMSSKKLMFKVLHLFGGFAIFCQKYLSRSLILWFFFYISTCAQKLCVAWALFNWLIHFNIESFGLERVTIVCLWVKVICQLISFQGLLWAVLFPWKRGDQRSSWHCVVYNPIRICLKILAAHTFIFFSVCFVFFHPGEITFL